MDNYCIRCEWRCELHSILGTESIEFWTVFRHINIDQPQQYLSTPMTRGEWLCNNMNCHYNLLMILKTLVRFICISQTPVWQKKSSSKISIIWSSQFQIRIEWINFNLERSHLKRIRLYVYRLKFFWKPSSLLEKFWEKTKISFCAYFKLIATSHIS